MKKCECKEENAWYNDFDIIKCQYCMGVITDLERIKRIVEYNMPVNTVGRMLAIAKEVKTQEDYIMKHF